MRTFLCLFLFVTAAHAQKAQLIVVDPQVNAEALSDQYEIHRPAPSDNKFPTRAEREKSLRGLSSVNDWDELKRDLFYMDLKKLPLKDLKKKYPEVSEKDYSTLEAK